MKRALYIGHSFHGKTKSTDFLIDLLSALYRLDVMTDESWAGGAQPDASTINDRNYDLVVFFQLISPRLVERLRCRNIVFFPMYDGCDTSDAAFWYAIRKCRIVNFSATVHRELERYDLDKFHIKFYPLVPTSNEDGSSTDGVFFWQRRNQINWATLKAIIGKADVGPIQIHRALDPGHRFMAPSPYEEASYQITYSDWFATRAEYASAVSSRRYYFAPRLKEGIGLSFLEAMAMGRAVIAPDHPTMNEYIEHGQNGYLYDWKAPFMLDLRDSARICAAAKESIYQGRIGWEQNIGDMIEFIDTPGTHRSTMAKPRVSFKRAMVKRILALARKIGRKMKGNFEL